MRWTSACTSGRDSEPRGFDWISGEKLLVLDALVALELDAADHRVLDHRDDEAAALPVGSARREQAGREQRLDAFVDLQRDRAARRARRGNRSGSCRDSTRRLPSTTIDEAVCATALPAVAKDATLDPRTTPPRTKPATASPRTRTQSPMRDAPYPYSQSPLEGQIGGICVPEGWFYPVFGLGQTLRCDGSPFPINALPDGHGHRRNRWRRSL